MKRIIGLLMVVGLWSGCGGDSDSLTGPQGQKIEEWTDKWDNGKVKAEYQYFRDEEGKVVKHGWYKEYNEDGVKLLRETYDEGKRTKLIEYDTDGNVENELTCDGNNTIRTSERGDKVGC